MNAHIHRIGAVLASAIAAVALTGCMVKKTEAPPLAGPSESGKAMSVAVTPDQLDYDGLSQSVIEIITRGPDGRPRGGVPLRVEIEVGGLSVDFGRLSNKTPVTNSDGVARVTYTAPPGPADPVDEFTVVRFYVSEVGDDFHGASFRYAEVRLVPKGILLPPNNPPVASFIVTPTPITTFTPVTFDASATRDEGVACNAACSYSWNFGDGSSGSGMVVTHEFKEAVTYVVRLTVMDQRGMSATTAQTITVAQTEKPKADFVFSPPAPRTGQQIFFNATASTAAPRHRIVSYDWDFGTGRTGTGVTISKGYDTAGTYRVTLTVSDDTFQPTGIASVTKDVAVVAPPPPTP